MYKEDGLKGGHVIMLGPGCEEAALAALQAYPQGLQIGGAWTQTVRIVPVPCLIDRWMERMERVGGSLTDRPTDRRA